MNRQIVVLTATCGSLIACATNSASGIVDVVFSQVTGNPTALVPAGAGLPAGTEFKLQTASGFDRPFASPDGTKIFFTGLANLATTEDECYILIDGATASVVAREGTAFGSPTTDLLGTGDQRMGVNNNGQFVFGADTTAATTADKMVIHWNGAAFVVAAREGDPVPGVATETWGNSLNSGHILADNTVCHTGNDTAGTLTTLFDDFCMVGASIKVQNGDPIGMQVWDAINGSDFWVSPDGLHWMVVGDDDTAVTTQDRIVTVDGTVVIREGVPLIGSSFISPVVALAADEQIMLHDGSWMARGNNADTEDWAVRNGVVLATTDDPITPGDTELYDDTPFADGFFFIAGNSVGDWVIGGTTNAVDANANAVLVLNGTSVAVREGDPVDLNGNGLPDDDAFVSVFNNDDGVLTDDLRLVFFADVRNAALTSLGQMVLSIDLGEQPIPCVADIFPQPDGDGQVNVDDLLMVINAWGACANPNDCPADIAPKGGDDQVNVDDLLGVINGWGSCP